MPIWPAAYELSSVAPRLTPVRADRDPVAGEAEGEGVPRVRAERGPGSGEHRGQGAGRRTPHQGPGARVAHPEQIGGLVALRTVLGVGPPQQLDRTGLLEVHIGLDGVVGPRRIAEQREGVGVVLPLDRLDRRHLLHTLPATAVRARPRLERPLYVGQIRGLGPGDIVVEGVGVRQRQGVRGRPGGGALALAGGRGDRVDPTRLQRQRVRAPVGVTSCVCAKSVAALGLLTRVAHTCTAPVERPPRTWTLTVCAAVAVVVSRTVE